MPNIDVPWPNYKQPPQCCKQISSWLSCSHQSVITSATHAVNTSLQQMHHVDYQTKRYIYMYEHEQMTWIHRCWMTYMKWSAASASWNRCCVQNIHHHHHHHHHYHHHRHHHPHGYFMSIFSSTQLEYSKYHWSVSLASISTTNLSSGTDFTKHATNIKSQKQCLTYVLIQARYRTVHV